MAKQESGPLVRKGDRILFEGDSLSSRRSGKALDTWPFLRLMNWHETYAEAVENWLFCIRPDLNLSFTITAVGGSSCREMAARYEERVKPYKPAWVVFTLGGNDCRREIPLEEFRQTLLDYAARLAKDSGGKLAIVGGFKPCPYCPQNKVDRVPTIAPYYRTLQQVARKTGGVYIDAGAPLLRKANLLYKQSTAHTVYSDGGHFNSVANTIVAHEIIKGLGLAEKA